MIENSTFPRFSIIVGPKGSGKKTLAHSIYQKFGTGLFINIGVSVDSVRQCISESYTIRGSQAIYLFADADNMSNAAKNALLKVTEEPPNNAYFIMTLEDENNTLETIRSRATVFHMDRYTPDEIYQYAMGYAYDNEDIIKDICETPGDVDLLYKDSPKEFYDYVELVVDNINTVSISNAFKIPSKIALKEGAEGYDLRLFWKAFQKACIERAMNHTNADDIARYGTWCIKTSRYTKKLKITGVNKQMLVDNWILEIREE